MKKLLAILLSLCLVATVFAACSKQDDADHGNEPGDDVSASVLTTDEAVITEADAIRYVQSYTAEELSLSAEDYEACSFMVNQSGVEIDGDYYIKVIAAITVPHTNEDGTESYTFDNKGEYYIRYDGKQILKKDMTSAEPKYDELEVKEVPETTESTETTAAAEEEATDVTE
ncbi:MAG: hypothetical protein IJ168_08865 [Eubacterium sp.]|nr:hypothetical protein [Eubacterium sp.]